MRSTERLRSKGERRRENAGFPLSESKRQLEEAREVLEGIELPMLLGVASVLCEVVNSLARTAQELIDARPSGWMTPRQAAEYMGFESVDAFLKISARENVPKHYLSDRTIRYNSKEIDAWIASRPNVPPCA